MMSRNMLLRIGLCLGFWASLNLGFAQTVKTYYTNAGIGFEGITWMPNGDIYTVDYFGGDVYQLKPDGTLNTIAIDLGNVAGGGADAEGNFYYSVFDKGTVYKVDPSGQISLFVSGLVTPAGLHLSADSNYMYVAEFDSSRVSKIDLSNKSVTKVASGGGMLGVDGITVMPNGDILAASFYNTRITRIKPDGSTSLFGMHPSAGFMGYIARAGDYYYVPSIGGHTIARFDSLGNSQIIAGTGVQGNINGSADMAQFDSPNGITANAAGDSILITSGTRIRLLTGLELNTNIDPGRANSPYQIYPSPFGQRLWFDFSLQANTNLKVEILDLRGQLVADFTPSDSSLVPQTHEFRLADLPAGLYFFSIKENDVVVSMRKITKR
ncbi:MAG: SMP-30/gluconolactonase/LRE family protein [Bacteroidota bacterium]